MKHDSKEQPSVSNWNQQFGQSASIEDQRDSPSLLPTVLLRLGLGNTCHSAEIPQDQLIGSLHSPAWSERVAALQTLAKAREPAPLEPFLDALNDESGFVRAAAARVLGKMGERVPREPLITTLHDVEWRVRAAAVLALGELHMAPEPLLAMLADEDESVRAAAVSALGSRGKGAPPEVLKNAFDDPSWLVSQTAKLILEELGEPFPVEFLAVAPDNTDETLHEAAEVALQQTHPAAFDEPTMNVIVFSPKEEPSSTLERNQQDNLRNSNRASSFARSERHNERGGTTLSFVLGSPLPEGITLGKLETLSRNSTGKRISQRCTLTASDLSRQEFTANSRHFLRLRQLISRLFKPALLQQLGLALQGVPPDTQPQVAKTLWLKVREKLALLLIGVLLLLGWTYGLGLIRSHGQTVSPPSTSPRISVPGLPGPPIFLEDLFSSNDLRLHQDTSAVGAFAFKEGAYSMVDLGNQVVSVALPHLMPNEPMVYRLAMREVQGDDTSPSNSFGMIFQQANGGPTVTTSYGFEVTGTPGTKGKYRFYRYESSQANPWTTIWTKNIGSEFYEGHSRSNTIEVIAIGNKFSFRVNGQMVGSSIVDKTSSSAGEVGFLVAQQGTEVAFSNLRMTAA